MKFWANVLFYQATWLVAITGAAHGVWWAGPAALSIFALWQLGVSELRRADITLMVSAAAIGFAIDSALVRAGLVSYATALPWPNFAPVWIVALWMSFALTLNHSLAYLKSHLVVSAALGGVGAPLAYWAAASTWGALTFNAPATVVLATLAVVWAILTPALCRFAVILSRRGADPLAVHGVP